LALRSTQTSIANNKRKDLKVFELVAELDLDVLVILSHVRSKGDTAGCACQKTDKNRKDRT